jgi:hypothetical protein
MKKYIHTSAFAHFGLKLANTYWSWSARDEEQKIVAVNLWQHEFSNGGKTYSRPPTNDVRLGFSELMQNLKFAQDHCGGRFNVVMAYAVDTTTADIKIKECFPWKNVMQLTHLDTATGAWSAELTSL